MTDPRLPPSNEVESYDRELDLKGIFWTGAGLAVIVVVAAAAMWLLSGLLEERASRLDAPLPRLPEARQQQLPPEPRLQTAPEEDLQELRREEAAILYHYAWTDATESVARVPIGRAMELLVEGGMPAAEAAPESPAPADAAEGSP